MARGNGPFVAGAKAPSRTNSVQEQVRRLEEAKAFLRQHVANGSHPARTLLAAATAEGIAERTLYRANEALRVTTERAGG